jgi:hypothetical protein
LLLGGYDGVETFAVRIDAGAIFVATEPGRI